MGSFWRTDHMPTLMGIVNCTPDSFFDGGQFAESTKAVSHALGLYQQGAKVLDIGGESTRPGSQSVSATEEIHRVLPVIQSLSQYRQIHKSDFLISVDTTKSQVAQVCLEAGADMINDVSMLSFDTQMISVVQEHRPYVVLSHIRGEPKTMQATPFYTNVLQEVADELFLATKRLLDSGYDSNRIILDPGIGFGKRHQDNLDLIAGADHLRALMQQLTGLQLAWLYGMSRKSYIGKTAGLEQSDRLIPSLVSAIEVSRQGIDMLRVHDVAQTREALLMAKALLYK